MSQNENCCKECSKCPDYGDNHKDYCHNRDCGCHSLQKESEWEKIRKIAEEVEKKISIHKRIIEIHTNNVFPKNWHEGNINAFEDVLSIIKHNQ